MDYPEVHLQHVKCMIDDMLYGQYADEHRDSPEIATLLELSQSRTICRFITPCGEIVGWAMMTAGDLSIRIAPDLA